LTHNIRDIEGVNNVISLPEIRMILKDTAELKFYLAEVLPDRSPTNAQRDSALEVARTQRIYVDHIGNTENGATMMLVSVQKEVMTSARREGLVALLLEAGDKFVKDTGIELRYAGLPFIRTYVAGQVKREMQYFLYASALVTGLIMFL